MASYYEARVYATIEDQNGTVIASADAIDINGSNYGEIDVTLDAPGQYGMIYTIHGWHSGRMYYSYQDDSCTTRDCVDYSMMNSIILTALATLMLELGLA